MRAAKRIGVNPSVLREENSIVITYDSSTGGPVSRTASVVSRRPSEVKRKSRMARQQSGQQQKQPVVVQYHSQRY